MKIKEQRLFFYWTGLLKREILINRVTALAPLPKQRKYQKLKKLSRWLGYPLNRFSLKDSIHLIGVVAKPRRSSWKKSWVTVGLSVNNWLSALTPLRPSFLSEADSIASDAEKQVRQVRDSTLARAHTRTRPWSNVFLWPVGMSGQPKVAVYPPTILIIEKRPLSPSYSTISLRIERIKRVPT